MVDYFTMYISPGLFLLPMKKRVLRVTGQGTVTAEPDLVVLSFDIEERNMEYEECILSMNSRVDTLRKELESFGIEKKALKTTDFSVKPDYVYDDKRRKQVFNGYLSHHKLFLKLDLNRERLNAILDTLAQSASTAKMSIAFEVKDKDRFRKAILEDAVRTAKMNAETIAAASGISIGQILSVEYNWREVQFMGTFVNELNEISPRASPDITPSEVSGTDSVTVVWEIL